VQDAGDEEQKITLFGWCFLFLQIEAMLIEIDAVYGMLKKIEEDFEGL
jgi:hypothetical protein